MQKLIWSAVCLALAACTAKKGDEAFHINGHFSDKAVGEKIYLRLMGEKVKIDTAVVAADGSFSFQGKVNEPTIASIYLTPTQDENQPSLLLFAETGTIEIQAKSTRIDSASVKGGENNQALQAVLKLIGGYNARLAVWSDSLKMLYESKQQVAFEALNARAEQVQNEEKKAVADFIKANGKTVAAAYIAFQINSYNPKLENVSADYQALDPAIQKTYFGNKLMEIMDNLKSTSIGTKAPEFETTDLYGQKVSLSSFRGKYVLLDFWASWCGPCRQENPNVVKAYEQYKNKNFTILGVSLDEDKEAWQKAIANDKLTWHHASDLAGWQSKTAQLYSVQSIPANFLLDPDGKIIAKDLRGEALSEALASVLK